VALVMNEPHYPEREACKLLAMDRSSYRYRPRPDHNAELRREPIALARQKPRFRYRRLCALLQRRGCRASPQAVRRLKRKRLVRLAPAGSLLTRATGRGLRMLTVVDSFTTTVRRSRFAATTARSSPAVTFWSGARNGACVYSTFSRVDRCRTDM